MAKELAFILINPYTIQKSRTGGVLARVIGRTDTKLVGARMFGPSRQLAEEYAALVRRANPDNPKVSHLLADYILRNYMPDAETGKPKRVMLLLFEGEDAVRKVWDVTGGATSRRVSGSTIRDTYGDYIEDDNGEVRYFEPAVLVGPCRERCAATLTLWARYTQQAGGIIENAVDVPPGSNVEQTLVMLKPDNFRFPSLRPGSIIDVLSCSGLRIVGIKKFAMTVAQAEEFYGPVREALTARFEEMGWQRVAEVLTRELGFRVPEAAARNFCREMGPDFAANQFESIVRFMTGHKPRECPDDQKSVISSEECLALVYQGVDAVRIIRDLLGPTDPNKARPGSVRREFGRDIMVNAAHASDSTENALREMRILGLRDDSIAPLVAKYYGNTI